MPQSRLNFMAFGKTFHHGDKACGAHNLFAPSREIILSPLRLPFFSAPLREPSSFLFPAAQTKPLRPRRPAGKAPST